MMPLGHVAPAALRQLAAWEALAADWATYQMADGENPMIFVERCGSCHIGIRRVTDEAGRAYAYQDGDRLALLVAHLRQAHQGLDPDR
jgi:hypothetical protein